MHDDYVYLPFKSDKMKLHFTEKIKNSFIKYYVQFSSFMPDLSNTTEISLVTKSNSNNSIRKEYKSSKSIAPVVSNQKDGVDSLSVDAKSANSSNSRSSDIGSSTANSTTSSCRSGVKKGKNVKKNNKSVSDGNSIKKYFGGNSEPDANVSTSSSSSKRYPVCKKRTSLVGPLGPLILPDNEMFFLSINDRFFKMVDVDGDGNCLPAAIAKSDAMQALYSDCDHQRIRNLISSWISEGMQQIEGSIL